MALSSNRNGRKLRDLCWKQQVRALDSLPRTRAEALALGATRYYTGEPCPKGHLTWRTAKDAQCRQCKAESQARSKGLCGGNARRMADDKLEELRIRRLERGE